MLFVRGLRTGYTSYGFNVALLHSLCSAGNVNLTDAYARHRLGQMLTDEERQTVYRYLQQSCLPLDGTDRALFTHCAFDDLLAACCT